MLSDIMVNYILKDENALVEAPEVNTSQLPPEFFAGHASERLSDPLRVHDENENSEVKTRTIQGLVNAGIMGPLGNYTKNAPRHVAVRTHFLDSFRNPIGVNEKGLRHSHGNTIVSIVRPHKRHRTPQVQTVMLRGNHQKFGRGSGPGTMDVDLAIDASPEKIKTNNPQVAIRRARKAKQKKAARVRIKPPLPPGPGSTRPLVKKMVLVKPMKIAYQLLKDDDKNRTMEDAFDLGQEILPYDKLHDKQKQIVDTIANAPASYWNDPASGELETEYYAGMFENDRQHFYPEEAFNQYLRYIQHFHDASSKVNELPHEKQVEIMSHYDNFQEKHPLHPAKVALDKMAEEHEDWGGFDPHKDFWQRYNEPQALMGEDGFSQDFIDLNKMVLIKAPKRKMSEAARQHKLAYDKKYESSPERVKYRVDLNRERRRRGIYGSNNKKDISHTQGGKFTLENQSSNRARHFKNQGTLRKVKVKK
jgi:hypothetical protein